jgi:hypothetical protein
MPSFLKPQLIGAAGLRDVQIAMRKDLQAAARRTNGKEVKFMAARDVKLPDGKKTSVLVVPQNATEAKVWKDTLKATKSPAFVEGTCVFEKGEKATHIVIHRVMGSPRPTVVKFLAMALKNFPMLDVRDATVEKEKESEE